MAENGHQRVVIPTVNTDVLVLAISTFDKLQYFVQDLWLDFGAGKNRKFYIVHGTYEELGKSKAMGLPFSHAFTGCDQVSFLSHITKSNVWKVWKSYDEVTPYFASLSNQPSLDEVRAAMPTLERFTLKRVRDMIITYSQMHRTDKYSQHSSIIWPVWLNG